MNRLLLLAILLALLNSCKKGNDTTPPVNDTTFWTGGYRENRWDPAFCPDSVYNADVPKCTMGVYVAIVDSGKNVVTFTTHNLTFTNGSGGAGSVTGNTLSLIGWGCTTITCKGYSRNAPIGTIMTGKSDDLVGGPGGYICSGFTMTLKRTR